MEKAGSKAHFKSRPHSEKVPVNQVLSQLDHRNFQKPAYPKLEGLLRRWSACFDLSTRQSVTDLSVAKTPSLLACPICHEYLAFPLAQGLIFSMKLMIAALTSASNWPLDFIVSTSPAPGSSFSVALVNRLCSLTQMSRTTKRLYGGVGFPPSTCFPTAESARSSSFCTCAKNSRMV